METDYPFSKRIKRHVTCRTMDFFAVATPGLEKLCFDELMSLPLSVKSAMVVPGGVEFKGRVNDCYLANLNLRTASRILMRIGTFKATNFNRLEKKLCDFPWELFLSLEARYSPQRDKCERIFFLPQISVSSRHSRLFHKNAITARFQDSIVHRMTHTDLQEEVIVNFEEQTEEVQQHLFIRVVDDRFIISIDSSGKILYKRGIKTQGGTAPLRESIAAALLKLADYNPLEPLIDPMCGTGTFSLEGAMMAMNMAPGEFREFAFMKWPSFRPRQWAYIKRESQDQVRPVHSPMIFASDKEASACHILQQQLQQHDLSGIIKVSCRDFFDFAPHHCFKEDCFLKGKGLVVLNPPYGLRISTKQKSEDQFRAISDKLKKDYKGWKVALIVPEVHLIKKIPFKLKPHRFYHGGLKLTVLTGKIP